MTTIHKDLTDRLRTLDSTLWRQVHAILARNKAERHLRGGEATRMKYRGEPQPPADRTPRRQPHPR